MIDHDHRLVGRAVVYRDPYGPAPEQGTITSVNAAANIVFVRYGLGETSAGTVADERLSFISGGLVRDALREQVAA